MKPGWQMLRMRDVMAEFYDGPHATPAPSNEGPVFLGIKNLTEDGHLDFTDIRHIAEADYARWTNRVEPRPGDLVFTYEASLHRYAILPPGFRGTLGRRVALIRPKSALVDTRFLLYVFLSPQWRASVNERINIGSTVDRIPLVEFPRFPIAIPPLLTQRKIASILSAYDDLIENNARRVKILEEMAQRIYREWFVEFRYPGHEGVPLVDSELGPLPEGWAVKPVRAALELAYGKALRADDRRAGPTPVYGSGGIVGRHDTALVEGPGLIIGRKGNVGSIYWSDDPFFPIDTTYYVKTSLPLTYIYFAIRCLDFIDSHAAVPGLSREQAYGLPFLIPDIDVCRRFDEVIEQLFALRRTLTSGNNDLRASRDLLLPRLISGEIDVEHLEIDTSGLAA